MKQKIVFVSINNHGFALSEALITLIISLSLVAVLANAMLLMKVNAPASQQIMSAMVASQQIQNEMH